MSDTPPSKKTIGMMTNWYESRIEWWRARWTLAHESRHKAFLAITHSDNPHELGKLISDYDYEIQLCVFAFSVLSEELDYLDKLKNQGNS